ncbi:MAG: glycosyltransferase family 39 protein [Candidatus Daviesbacteria bacterium]|nr:glycosyltransferase family 39 protein [Candidatus Daviesbacteria bacterium]
MLIKRKIFNPWPLIASNKLITILFILSFILRIWGTNPGFHPFHPDEPQVYARALYTLLDKSNEFGYVGYPALVPLIHGTIYGLLFIPINILIKLDDFYKEILINRIPLEQFLRHYIFGLREINVLFWGRYLNAFLGSISIVLAYLVGKKYFSNFVGLVGALFLTVNYRHILASHFSLVDVPNDLFLLISLLVIREIIIKGRYKDYILSSIAAGLSASVKLSPFALMILFLAHFLKSLSPLSWKKFLIKSFLIVVIFFSTLVIVNIEHVINFQETVKELGILNKRYGGAIFEFSPYPYIYLFNHGLTPAISILFLVGVVYGLKKYFRMALLMVSTIFLFCAYLTYYSTGGIYVRNFVGIVPLIVILSALGLECFVKSRYFKSFFANKAFLLIGLGLLMYISFRDVLILNTEFSKPWNFVKAKEYLSTLPGNSVIAIHPWFASLTLPEDLKTIELNNVSDFSLSELQDLKAQYALIDTDFIQSEFTWWMGVRGENAFLEQPTNLFYSTFTGGAIKELLAFKEEEFVKPWQAPDTNFFLVKIPNRVDFRGKIIAEEKFEEKVDWQMKGFKGKDNLKIIQIFDKNKCLGNGCVEIASIPKGSLGVSFLESTGVPRFIRFTSNVLAVDPGYYYKISAKISSNKNGKEIQKSAFLKAELFKERDNAEGDKAGDNIFISSRYQPGLEIWQEKSIALGVPKGYKYMTISFQIDRNGIGDFYFDDLKIEKSREKTEIEDKDNYFPEDLIFPNSIL